MAIGASRMIHHSTFCTTASAERTKDRNGSAASPTLRVAMPMAIATTRICSTLNDIDTLPSSPADPSRPSTLAGTRPVRKSSHEPVLDGALAASAVTLVWSPGWSTRPSTMPIETAISAVMANQASVFHASRAAPVTSRRFAMEATIARNTSGGTTARSSVTKVPPMVLSVSVSQLGSTSPVAASTPSAPMLRATRPRTTPSTSPVRTCTPNEGSRKRVGFAVSVTEVFILKR